MPAQPANTRFRQGVKGFYAWLGSLIAASAAPFIAIQLIDTGALAGRIAGVAVGTLGWTPMVAVIISIIRAGDEFQRRIHLVALALSFASGLLLLTLVYWLARAAFMQVPSLPVLWLSFAALWFTWLFVVKRYYESH